MCDVFKMFCFVTMADNRFAKSDEKDIMVLEGKSKTLNTKKIKKI